MLEVDNRGAILTFLAKDCQLEEYFLYVGDRGHQTQSEPSEQIQGADAYQTQSEPSDQIQGADVW